MGNNLAKTAKCEADPTILPPAPPMTMTPTAAPDPALVPPAAADGGPPVDQRFKDNPGTMEEFHKRTKGKI